MPLLEVEDLRVDFHTDDGVVSAVQGVSYTLDDGETLGIVGESGSGKSVGTMALMRLLPSPPARITGSIRFEGEDVLALPARRMREIRGNKIAMIFQDPMTCLNPFLRISTQLVEAIELHTELKGKAARDRAVVSLERVGIPGAAERLDEYPHQFSGGMRQRVMIAMALACEPKLLIADEPTTALDVTIQAQILELMKELTRKLGVAMIIITHNLGVVARYADRVNVMYAGRIIESGTAEDIYHNPKHPYTLALLRSVPRMDVARGQKLQPVDGQPPDLTKLDAGCAFRPRCMFATEQCARSKPTLDEVSSGHISACWEKDRVGFAEAVA